MATFFCNGGEYVRHDLCCRYYDFIIYFFGLRSHQRHTRYASHWSADCDGDADSFSLGPQREYWPVQGYRQTHLAVASNCERDGTPNEFVLPPGSARHGRTSRPRVSETVCSRTECGRSRHLCNFTDYRRGQPAP